MKKEPETDSFTPDTRIKLNLVAAIAAVLFIISTTAAGSVWATKISFDMEQLKKDIIDMKSTLKELTDNKQNLSKNQ